MASARSVGNAPDPRLAFAWTGPGAERNSRAMDDRAPHRPESPLLPRLLRLRDAPRYVGMDRNRFNAEVRPSLTEIPIGVQGIAFDRLELDAWVDDYRSRNGRPGRSKGDRIWDGKGCRASSGAASAGMSTNASAGGEFARALDALSFQKRKRS